MPMTPFMDRFPELGRRETRTILAPRGAVLPVGEWAFIECYCDEPGCDCRRVIITVLRPDTGWEKTWATISFGWESPEFYQKWGHDDSDLKGPYLDPLNSQSKYADELLDLLRWILRSSDYVARLQRHYQLFRETVDGPSSGTPAKDGRRRRRTK